MKKYKLIKEYPGSPFLGKVLAPKVIKEETNTNNFYWGGSWFNPNDFPEFWEEVVEKDYQILETCPIEGTIYSVKRLSDGEVFTVGDKFTISEIGISSTITEIVLADSVSWTNPIVTKKIFLGCENDYQYVLSSVDKVVEKDYEILSYLKKGSTTCTTTKRRGGENHKEFWNIYSVKRLSDGEIFTVGDKIKVYQHGSMETITEIIINVNSLVKEGIWFRYNTGSCHMTHIIKQKPQLIYLTHDGKDIFEGEQVWFVNKENLYFDYIMVSLQTNFCSEKRAYFLTRKEAEEYIRKNKVLFVADDGVNIFEEDIVYVVDSTNSIHTVKVLLSNIPTEGKKCYSTYEAAENYAIQHSRALSIEDFWKVTCMSTSNFNKTTYMENLVKQRLNLK